MASTEMTTSGILNLRDGDWSSRASKACDFIASACGLSLSGSETSGSSVRRYYMYGNIGLRLSYSSSSTSNTGSISVASGYMSSGEWTNMLSDSGGISCTGAGDKSNSNAESCYLYSKKIEIGSLTATRFAFEGSASSFYFAPFTVTDYFSGESRTGFTSGGGFFTYDKSGQKGETMTVTPIAGGSYGSQRVLTVAEPVILRSTSFYGMTDNLYYIAGVTALLGDQIQLNGNTFTCITDNVFAG